MLDGSQSVEPLALERAADHSHPLRGVAIGTWVATFIGVDEVTEIDQEAAAAVGKLVSRAGSPTPG